MKRRSHFKNNQKQLFHNQNNMTDFLQYKFRCSGLVNLLVDPRSKTEPLSATTKTYLKDIWIKETYDRERPTPTSKAMEKGIACETDSIELIEKVTGEKYFKNSKHFDNEYIKGTPDVITPKILRDIKTNWNIWTFAAVDEKYARDTYFPQVLGYMALTNKKTAIIDFALVNLPEHMIFDEFRKMVWQGIVKEDEEGEAHVRKLYTYDDIPAEKRIKSFTFEWDQEMYDKIVERIKVARFYMNSLEL